MTATREAYEQLCQLIRQHNQLYYHDHAPQLSDQEYDHLVKKLELLEAAHPEWVTPASPVQAVGEGLTRGFATVQHRTPMLSLANTYSKEEIGLFIQRMAKLSGEAHPIFNVELKIDGIAVTALFKNGAFVQAATRGDGTRGDEITANMRAISNFPQRLAGAHWPDLLEIRGEVFMPQLVFQQLNDARQGRGEPLWANPRNAAAGSLKLLDSQETAKRQLAVVFYGIAEASPQVWTQQSEVAPLLSSWGLPVLDHQARCHSLAEIWDFAEQVRVWRRQLPYAIDGIVIKLDDVSRQKQLGNTGKNLRWAIAYKFAAEQAETRLEGITLQVGRSGVLTPVAELKPVLLAGSLIARATLHNQEEIQRKDIRIGDVVIIEKGGDVIPKIIGVNLSLRSADAIPWVMPDCCPSCGAEVMRVGEEVAVCCSNPQGCLQQRVQRLCHFASKEAMDIDHMGKQVIIQLVHKGFVQVFSDIYTLTVAQLAQLTGFQTKSAQQLWRGIAQSKKTTLSRLIMALGIRHVGAGVADLLAQKAGTIEHLMEMSAAELKQIAGIGDKVAEAVLHYFAQPEHRSDVRRLLALGVEPQVPPALLGTGHPFQAKHFVLTGTLGRYTRPVAAALIKERGGYVADSVTTRTDYLVVGADPGSKLDKAQKLGVHILSEEAFAALL